MIENGFCCDIPLTRAELRRRKLIETARNLFIRNGFHATGMAQIAEQSEIAIGQIYRDFSSKEDIVAALVREDCARYMEAAKLDAAIQSGDSEAVLLWLHHFVQPSDDIDGDRLFAEIVAESSRNERIAAIFVTLQDDLRARLLNAMAILAPGGTDLPRRAVLADAIMTFSLGMVQHRLFRPGLQVLPLVQALQTVITNEVEALKATAA